MVQSSAKFVSYDLRPSKQCERKLMLECFRAATECGFLISDYRYVGMGANRFYDYMLLHKYFGVTDMISLEHDEDVFKRANFNKPYGFIKVGPDSATQFIAADVGTKDTVYWLDYDGGVGPHITGDIFAIAPRIRLNSFLFVTVCAEPPKVLEKKNFTERLAFLQDALGDLASALTKSDLEGASFPQAVQKIWIAAFRNAFAVRSDGIFSSFFRVQYTDGMKMLTVGCVMSDNARCQGLIDTLKNRVPVLNLGPDESYKIRKFDITEKERGLLDLAVTAGRSSSREINYLKKLGFSDTDIQKYREIVRYHPRYIEAIL